MADLTHLDETGSARMVDIAGKPATMRTASAKGRIAMSPAALAAIRAGTAKKGDVLAVARVAGIMAAKRTSDLIPLCHPVALTAAAVDFVFEDTAVCVTATAETTGSTGVEMEALTAVSVALLTIYDMVKAIDKRLAIKDIHVLSKTGGRSGDFTA
jgi:cyclic pyranopterin monophosphate synthase